MLMTWSNNMISKNKSVGARPTVEMMEEQIVELEKKIRSCGNRRKIQVCNLFGGTDVIIEFHETERTKHFLGSNQPYYINGVNYYSGRQVVITKDAKELSWLFKQIRDIIHSRIDYVSRYEFFGILAQTSNEFIRKFDDTQTSEQLLLHVLEVPKYWLYNLRENKKKACKN